jgi:hypothetical protein
MALGVNPYEIYFGPTDVQSYAPNADLEGSYQCFVKITGDKQVGAVTLATNFALGVLINRPNNTTGPSLEAKVQTRGTAKVKTGTGGLAASELVTTDKDGLGVKLDPAVGGAYAYGQCVVGAAVGLAASVVLFGAPVWIPEPAGE